MKDSYSRRYKLESLRATRQLSIGPAFRQCHWWHRSLPLMSMLFATLVSIALGILHYVSFTISGVLSNFVLSDRSTVQVIVQVISYTLGALSVVSICNVLNYRSRSSLYEKSCLLNSLRLWSALSQASIGWNLPFLSKIGTMVFWGLTLIPASVWTGALTPRGITQIRNVILAIPLAGKGSYPFLRGKSYWITQDPNGNHHPIAKVVGKLIDSASSATTPDGTARNHSKFDNVRYHYMGRSFGVGAAVGLTDSDLLHSLNLQEYSYTETGYTTTTHCIYNTSSLWTLSPKLNNGTELGLPSYFWAQGWFPNSDWDTIFASDYAKDSDLGWDWYFQSDFSITGDNIVSMGSHDSDAVSRYFVAIAAGSNYHELSEIQCELFFIPTRFSIHVSKATSTITVKSTNETVSDPEPRGILRSTVLDGLNSISMVTTSLYTSTIGEALVENINNTQAQQFLGTSVNPDPRNVSNATRLAAVSDSVTAMADDLLVSLAAAALVYPKATGSTPVIAEQTEIVIGSTVYLIAIIAINLTLLLIVTVTTLRTRFWAQLPVFDYTDLGCMSIGLAANKLRSEPQRRRSMDMLRHWNGDPRDEAMDRMALRLEVEPGSNLLSVSLK